MSGAEPSMRTATCLRWTCCELVALRQLRRQIHLALFCSWRMLAFASDRNLNQIAPLTACPQLTWKELVETVILETDSNNLPQCIQDAQDAIMDEIEDSFSNRQFKR